MLNHRSVGWVVFTLVWALVSPVTGQDALTQQQDEPTSTVVPVAELDVGMLLEVNEVLPTQIQDTVWTMATLPGRRLVKLPVRLSAANQETKLDKPSFWLKGGGRFICWQIPPADGQAAGGAGGAGWVSGGGYGSMGFEDEFQEMPGASPYGQAYGQPYGQSPSWSPMMQPPAGQEAAAAMGVPENAPRVARTITLTADGQVSWELDRVLAQMPGVTAGQGSTSLYALKARPDLLRELEPQRPGAVRSGGGTLLPGGGGDFEGGAPAPQYGSGNAAQNAAQRRAAEEEYRRQVNAFRELRDQVNALPETFTQPIPSHVWAIFELTSSTDELSFGGEPPLPWHISISNLQLLAEVAKTSAGQGPLDASTSASVFQLSQMARDAQPLTHRLIASVLVRSNLIGRAIQGDGLHQLIGLLLAGADLEAQRTVLEGLVAVNPPTAATTQLLNSVAASLPPSLQLIQLRGLMRGNAAVPAELSTMTGAIRTLLMNPDGPDAGDVLNEVVLQVGQTPETVAIFGGAINFSELPPPRLDQAAAYVLSSAATQPLSAAWLDRGLLGSFDAHVSQRTLQIIAHADRGKTFGRKVANAVHRLAFGPRPTDASIPQVQLSEPIPLNSPRHALLSLLQSSNQETSDLAWSALLAFNAAEPSSIGSDPRQPPQPAVAGEVVGEVIDRVMKAAFSQKRTPSTLAPFLSQQLTSPQATNALIKLVIEGDKSASGQGARSLLGSNRMIAAAMADLSLDDRAHFAAHIYEAIKGKATRVVNLMRQPDGMAAVWFCQRLSVGDLPQPSDWASSSPNENTLLQQVTATDADLAQGAVAALVFAAGGDDTAVDEQIQKFANLSDRTESGIISAWGSARQDIFTRRLADAAGTYSLVLNLYPPGTPIAGAAPSFQQSSPAYYGQPFGGEASFDMMEEDVGFETQYLPPPPPPQTGVTLTPSKTLRLATVDLMADGATVRFRHATVALSVPTDTFAIRINSAGELKNFPETELESLDLESIADPIDLLPQTDGSWKGHGIMRDGQIVEVLLKPTDEQ
ncbi:MAG: hypothetical protein IT445_06500 [Phycisphaeraceae bacterium]|nr:hypothetical protein [Phycisphaeraceae bacterium]